MKSLIKTGLLVILMSSFTFLQVFSQDIFTAVAEGNVELTRQFLEKDPGLINKKNSDLMTPLNLAAERGQVEVAAFLLKMGADPTIGDRENSQPVHLAAISGSIPILDMLLEQGVDINTKDINQMTPLLFAASRGQSEMVRHLVDHGADVRQKTLNGLTVLNMASISGNMDMAKLMVSKGAQVNSKSDQGFTPLFSAASYGRTEMVQFLVEKGADINIETNDGAQPLAWAVGRNSHDAALYLINKGAEVDHKDNDGFTALHNAAGRGNIAVAQLLIDKGADVNASTPNGFVPLSDAAMANNAAEMGRLLILNGADVNPDPCKNNKECTCGPNFRTPLHFACQGGKTALAEILVNNGAKINLLSNEGLTPLQYAVMSGKIEVVALLVDNGAFLNVQEKEQGSTELHMAAALGYGDIAQLLLEEGSCPAIRDLSGKTPLDYAFYHGQNQIGYEMMANGGDDSKLKDYVNTECLPGKKVNRGEAEVVYLGHSGWAVKTQNHLLVFDYFDDARTRKADHPCLASGFPDTAELKNQSITFFSTHDHADHFGTSLFAFRENLPEAEFILCFEPVGVSDEYTYLPVNSETEIDGMKVYVIKSTDSGGGYLVEVDGLTIFHMGDHANGDDALMPEFTNEIDLVANQDKDIDILFGPIRGCSLGTPEQVKTGTYYTLDKLHPALFVPMHSGSYTFQNKIFAEQARENGLIQNMKYVTAKGDRFEYRKGEEMVDLKNTELLLKIPSERKVDHPR